MNTHVGIASVLCKNTKIFNSAEPSTTSIAFLSPFYYNLYHVIDGSWLFQLFIECKLATVWISIQSFINLDVICKCRKSWPRNRRWRFMLCKWV